MPTPLACIQMLCKNKLMTSYWLPTQFCNAKFAISALSQQGGWVFSREPEGKLGKAHRSETFAALLA